MNKPRPIKTKFVDEYGYAYKDAVIYALEFSEHLQKTSVAASINSEFAKQTDLSGFTYCGVFYGDGELAAAAGRARPMLQDEGDNFSPIYSVDMSNPQINNLLNSNLSSEEISFRIIEADLKYRFK